MNLHDNQKLFADAVLATFFMEWSFTKIVVIISFSQFKLLNL